jgi:hypothetical protein
MDAQCAAYYVYDTFWFYGLLYALGVNIVVVALSRLPWKRQHIPFLLAHVGIILLLLGAWVTKKWGVDALLQIKEGAQTRQLFLPKHTLWFQNESGLVSRTIPFFPPEKTWTPQYFKEAKVWIRQYLAHAHAIVKFATQPEGAPAIHLKIEGGPMGLNQDFWLWEGSPDWQKMSLGPAEFRLGAGFSDSWEKTSVLLEMAIQGTQLQVQSFSSTGEKKRSHVALAEAVGSFLDLNWKGGVRVLILDILPKGQPEFIFKKATIQYGNEAPDPAMEVVLDSGVPVWLGLGSRMHLQHDATHFTDMGFVANELSLPFELKLVAFKMEFDPGTKNPARYASDVEATLNAGAQKVQARIEMNEPLKLLGYTLYQSSFQAPIGNEGYSSVFTVNADPGRVLKYVGSALIVLGSILLFDRHRKRALLGSSQLLKPALQ